MIREMERGEIKLGEEILGGLLAWGQKSLQGPLEQLPRNDFRSEMVAMKAPLPVNPLRPPKVVVRVDGKVGVSPPHRLPDYMGPPWCLIEVDWAGLKLLRARAEAEPAPAPPTEPQQRSLLLLPDEPQLEGPREWQPAEAPAWFENAKRIHLREPRENKSAYARRLHKHMETDFGENIPWTETTLRRRLNDPSTEDD
jgi:hypothetical protein